MLFYSGLEQIKSLKGGRQKEMQSCKRYAKQSVRWEVSRALMASLGMKKQPKECEVLDTWMLLDLKVYNS